LIADEEGDIIPAGSRRLRNSVGTVELDVHAPDSRHITGAECESIRQRSFSEFAITAAKNNFKKASVGLSGGIDSALVAALACEALGAENLLCCDDAVAVFVRRQRQRFGRTREKTWAAESRIEPISGAFEVLLNQMKFVKPSKGGENLAAENMQSRLRGVILMAISNAEGRLLLSTGNKSELAVGYCTLYGDTNGGLAVLGDVLKTEAWEIARQINKNAGREIIPEKIILKKPSAELAPNQFDQDSLPPYELMDPILELYFEHKKAPSEIVAQGHDARLVYEILNKVEHPANEFKRQQLPPTIIISRNAIGVGRRRPITHKYRRAQ
jgi:NAD+ synthetase